MTIDVERTDWGIMDTLYGEVSYQDVLDALERSWIDYDWDTVNRRLAIFKPGLRFVFDDKDPTVLARVMRPSLTGKRFFRHALVVPSGDEVNRAIAEEFAADVNKSDIGRARVFSNRSEALCWLLKTTSADAPAGKQQHEGGALL